MAEVSQGKGDEAASRLVFYPFAYALFTDELADYCWYCLKPDVRKKHCTGCGFALFCDKTCQTLGWKDHKAECKGFRKAKEIPDIEVRLLGRIVIRHKAIYSGKDKEDPDFYKDRESKRSIMDIWSHHKDMSEDPRALQKFDDIYGRLVNFYDEKFLMTKETVWQLHCRDYINRHAICDQDYKSEIGKGLFLDLCQYDHSCRPNSIYTCDGFVATLRSLSPGTDLRVIDKTFYTYIDLLLPMQQRRKQLRDTWYFSCECGRCTDNKDHLLTAVLCPNCPIDDQQSLCIFGNQPYKDPESLKIKCPKCEKTLANEYVALCIETMRSVDDIFEKNELDKMKVRKEQLDFLNALFHQYARLFPATNVFLGRLIQGLIERISSDVDLLRLHIASEPCVRLCFPDNHPAVAFHLRNIGIFLSNLDHYEEAIPYHEEADHMLTFVFDEDHALAKENKGMLEFAKSKVTDIKRRERFANLSTEQKRALIEEDIRKLRLEQASKDHEEKKKEKAADKVAKKENGNGSAPPPALATNGSKIESSPAVENSSSSSPSKPLVSFTDTFEDMPPLVAE